MALPRTPVRLSRQRVGVQPLRRHVDPRLQTPICGIRVLHYLDDYGSISQSTDSDSSFNTFAEHWLHSTKYKESSSAVLNNTSMSSHAPAESSDSSQNYITTSRPTCPQNKPDASPQQPQRKQERKSVSRSVLRLSKLCSNL